MSHTHADDQLRILEDALGVAPAGLVVLGPDRRLRWVNRAAGELLGLDDVGVHGFVLDRLADVSGAVDRATVERQVARAGRPAWVEVTVAVVRDPQGQPRSFVAHIVDSTDHHRAGAELRHRTAMEALVTALSTRFINIDADDLGPAMREALAGLGELFGVDRVYAIRFDAAATAAEVNEDWWRDGVPRISNQILDLPRGAQRWWLRRLQAGELVAVRSLDELPPEGGEAAEALAEEGVRSILFLPLVSRGRADGFLGMEARRSERSWAAEEIALMRTIGEAFVSAHDRIRAENALALAVDELAQRNRELERSNSELETFADRAAHDLRAPLARMQMALHQLTDTPGVVLGTAGATLVEVSARAADRMAELIDDLLAYGRAGEPVSPAQPVDLGEVVDLALADLAWLVGDAEVEVRPLPTVLGHPTQLGQLLQNVLSNALKYRRPGVAPRIEVGAEPDGAWWRVSVGDNGVGIPEDQREEVFAMFTRLHSGDDYPGSGIGLATCLKVVTNHGGRIWIEDGRDGGCRVVFTLPAPA